MPEPPPPLEESIRRRAHEFEAPALVALLEASFPGRAIRFRSRPSFSPRPTLVDAVDFAPDHIVVTLNLGLFSSTTPMPSYFHELLAHPKAGPWLQELIALLDDRLLRDRVDGLRPEQSERLLPRPRDVRKSALAMARPASPATLHWVLQAVFPELGVVVRRAPVRRGMAVEDLRIGHAVLGYAALGGEAEVSTPGLDAVLCAEESTTWAGEPWAAEASRRLAAHVFPALGEAGVHLRVFLVDREGQGRLMLRSVAHLGFDPLAREAPPKVLILFEGRTP